MQQHHLHLPHEFNSYTAWLLGLLAVAGVPMLILGLMFFLVRMGVGG